MKRNICRLAVLLMMLLLLGGCAADTIYIHSGGSLEMPPVTTVPQTTTQKPSEEPTEVPAPDPTGEPPQPTESPSQGMVWVSEGGTKYHKKSSCSSMRDPVQITKSKAEKEGYTPCKRCYK